MPDPGYLVAVRELCTREGALLIFDEVMTGFRLHRAGVQGLLNDELNATAAAGSIAQRSTRDPQLRIPSSEFRVPSSEFPVPSSQLLTLNSQPFSPDLTCLGKIIGGGLPVGAFGGRADIMNLLAPLGPVYQAGTLSGNPLAMAAGIASLQLLDELNPYARLDSLGRQLKAAVIAAAGKKGIPVQVPQCGSMFSIFFTATPVRDYATALQSDAKLFARFFHACLARGVYLAPSAYEAGFLSTAHEGSAIDRACEVLALAINEL